MQGSWDENEDFGRAEWIRAVIAEDTQLGYWEWVESQY